VQRFRGGLVFKAHRLVYHSTLGLRVLKKKKKVMDLGSANWRKSARLSYAQIPHIRLSYVQLPYIRLSYIRLPYIRLSYTRAGNSRQAVPARAHECLSPACLMPECLTPGCLTPNFLISDCRMSNCLMSDCLIQWYLAHKKQLPSLGPP